MIYESRDRSTLFYSQKGSRGKKVNEQLQIRSRNRHQTNRCKNIVAYQNYANNCRIHKRFDTSSVRALLYVVVTVCLMDVKLNAPRKTTFRELCYPTATEHGKFNCANTNPAHESIAICNFSRKLTSCADSFLTAAKANGSLIRRI